MNNKSKFEVIIRIMITAITATEGGGGTIANTNWKAGAGPWDSFFPKMR